MNSQFSIEDKVCIVTGAGKGIGREAAKMYRDAGAKLALISRSKDDMADVVAELNMPSTRLFYMVGDVADEAIVGDFVTKAYDHYKEIDVLFNNAGMRFRKDLLDIDYVDWTNVLNNNLSSVFLMCRAVGPYMIAQKYGKIINVASIVGMVGLPELAAYGASKGGIIGFSKCLAVEWAPHNINVNIISPGFCNTSYSEKFKQNKKLYNFTIKRTPMTKWGESQDVVNASLFLASDASNYMTGEVITVDGGWVAA